MLGRYDRAMRARGPVGRLTLLQQAIAAIRRNNGTLFYVPSNFAGAWTDSAGTDPVNEVADVIGRMTDRSYGANNLGPELVTNGSFSSGSTGWSTPPGWSVSGGVCTASNTSSSMRQISTPCTAGRAYRVEFDWTHVGGMLYVRVGTGTATAFTTSGRKSVVLTAGNSSGFEAYGGTVSGAIDNISVREVMGAVATQATTANKPTVQINAQGRYVMRFDGSNDSLTTNITTGNEGWVCAGVTFSGAVGNFETVFANGAGNPTQKGVWLVRPAAPELLRMGIGNGTALTMPTITVLMGIPQVVEGGWTSTTVTVGLNGTTSSLARTGNATPAPQESLIGAYTPTVHFLNGPMTAQVICPVLPSAADRAIIRKWIGSLQGQSL